MKAEIDIQKLFDIAGGRSEDLAEELFSFNRFLNANHKLKTFFENNDIRPAARIGILKEITKGRSKLFKDLISLLIRNGLMGDIAVLTEKFATLVSREAGIDFAELYVPRDLDEAMIEEICAHFGGRIKVRVILDPATIGGFVLKFLDGRVYDASVAGGLQRLRTEMAQ